MGNVYLLGDYDRENVYKIGVTRGAIGNRIKKLQTGNSGEIYLVSSYSTKYPFVMEKMLHVKYAPTNILGEWFQLDGEEVKKFSSVCEECEKTITAMEDNYYFRKSQKLDNLPQL